MVFILLWFAILVFQTLFSIKIMINFILSTLLYNLEIHKHGKEGKT